MVFWAFTLVKVVIYWRINCLINDLADFLVIVQQIIYPEIFLPFKQVWRLKMIVFGLSVWLFKMESNSLPALLNNRFTTIEICLFCGGNTGSENITRSQTYPSFCSCIIWRLHFCIWRLFFFDNHQKATWNNF